mmetsp:Transcript_21865/g.60759  ORF Transcript_21865/g.60759 Transcript_21865/m.60759 type:complete len:85 (+) Transcript_21865:841-1095(+)
MVHLQYPYGDDQTSRLTLCLGVVQSNTVQILIAEWKPFPQVHAHHSSSVPMESAFSIEWQQNSLSHGIRKMSLEYSVMDASNRF